MANRRMFSLRIVNSARFLQMPEGAQLLYFHLCMRADDDGVVEAFPVLKMLGTAPDNFRILIAKDFIRQLSDDQISVVLDWREHNLIRADRKIDSIYKDLLRESLPNISILEPRPRADTGVIPKQITTGRPVDAIGKVRLGKININVRFDEFWKLYDKKIGRPKCEKAWIKLTDKERELIMAYLPPYKATTPDKQFRKHPYTFLNQRGWDDELVAQKEGSGGPMRLHDGSMAIYFNGAWVDARDKNVKIDLHYYPELTKL